VDLQERHQLEAARQQVAKVRARARPWRSIFALVLAVIAAAVSVQARYVAELPVGQRDGELLGPLGHSGNLALAYGTAVAFFLLAAGATIGLGNRAREVLGRSVGSSHAAVIRFAIVLAGGLATIVITLQLFDIAVTQLIVGTAVTGVILGIAAQQSLANVFSGIILLMARPFQVGDTIGIRSGALSGLLEGTVAEVSITYVRLETVNGPVHVPNSQVLAAAVGPAGAVPPPTSASAPAPGAVASALGQPGAPAEASELAALAAGSDSPAQAAPSAPGPGSPTQAAGPPPGPDSPAQAAGPAPGSPAQPGPAAPSGHPAAPADSPVPGAGSATRPPAPDAPDMREDTGRQPS